MIAAPEFVRTEGTRLLDRLAQLGVPLADLTADSRAVKLGSIFVAYPGTVRDGRAFIADAIARGATAVLWEHEGFEWNERWGVPNLGVRGLRAQISTIAGHVFGNPSDSLWMAGVTGTNGKTSVSQWIAAALDGLGRRSAVIGTLGNGLVGERSEAKNTTPDPIVLQRLLADYLRRGARAVAMEVSSHGLDQDRVAGIKYDAAVFTNLTRDHLDYHGTMEEYFRAKQVLFEGCGTEPPRAAVINIDDEYGRQLLALSKKKSSLVLSYGLTTGDFHAESVDITSRGTRFQMITPAGKLAIWSPMIGKVNVYNVLAACA
ncbi:MAG TPA: UDP-N-acetylmuramoyl-L-alanyl-D-glutamate--2,6-diaminopimelate ligase, partial [Usitatibacter sp.]